MGATTLKVLVSTNYTGSNTPSTATWTEVLSFQATTPTTGFGQFVLASANLSAFIGQTVNIAFKYEGGTGKTTTYELDDIKVLKN